MFGRPSLRDLFAEMREESQRRDEESQRRDEEAKRRDADFKRREDEFKGLVEETREYNREILLRNEKVYRSVITQLDKNTVQMESNTDETRAQTQALLRLIDRMNETGGAAAA